MAIVGNRNARTIILPEPNHDSQLRTRLGGVPSILLMMPLVGDNQKATEIPSMCGRFTLRTPTKAIVEAFSLIDAPDL
jgi:hypothetical protein